MKILTRDSLPLGGFAGLKEHRLVTDSRVFGPHKRPNTFEGLDNFVYLADARFKPRGETGMHPHHEIDVISVMIDGRIQHEGSLEDGRGLEKGGVQVQRAGGQGFTHNEVNPDTRKNRMIQLWVLPTAPGQAAGYKYYIPAESGVTRIYGGNKNQTITFDSSTIIEIANLSADQQLSINSESLVYLTKGSGRFIEEEQKETVTDGDLIRSYCGKLIADTDINAIVVRKSNQ
ncbi:pirin family protein [Microbulbifer sp. MLAF003]|uniref:pirin family protein n=1 Tax=Microbulbifer sp. MLAF003 TaxID=3032582 RepID=UPI0024ADB7B0|nr:pirin family protein [Microbulbifer sp. MLAF003]WHI50506.1 pirin family protein [Microbulbifer sp. MLAF003]